MTRPTLQDAMTFTRDGDGLTAPLAGEFSNGPQGMPPEQGFPFGGLLAAMCAGAMQEGLEITAPLRTLSVQYLAAARFGEAIRFRPRLLRGGRNVAYATVEAGQPSGAGERLTHHASATFGADADTVTLAPLTESPPPREGLDPARRLEGPMAPYFTRHVEYLHDGGPNILGGNEGRPAIERTWMRLNDGRPLDALRLCYLMDALYPPFWTALKSPPLATTVDLRYDILATPDAHDGWAFFEFRMLDLGRGWTVDEVAAWTQDGRPLAVGRQRRKLL